MKKSCLLITAMLACSSAAHALKTDWNWALDRLDGRIDGQYTTSATGRGQTVFIMDTGLTLGNSRVASEFGGRATVYDMNEALTPADGDEYQYHITRDDPDYGRDYRGHGTKVATIIGGKTYGVAKNANIVMAKVSNGSSAFFSTTLIIKALEEFKTIAKPGDILNYSGMFPNQEPNRTTVENLLKDLHGKGVIIVVSAGNDPSTNTSGETGSRLEEVFVVTATSNFNYFDNVTSASRYYSLSEVVGTQDIILSDMARPNASDPIIVDSRSVPANQPKISAYMPGEGLWGLDQNGVETRSFGETSGATAIMSGVFATACEAYSSICKSGNPQQIYNAIRSIGYYDTIYDYDGTTIVNPQGYKGRAIDVQW